MPRAADPLSSQPAPTVAVLVAIFTVVSDEFRVLLIQRSAPPDDGKWAIPGGALELDESLDSAAVRKLAEEAGATDVFLEQLYTFGDLDDQFGQAFLEVRPAQPGEADQLHVEDVVGLDLGELVRAGHQPVSYTHLRAHET